jgi:Ca-activated chloride channel homolog
MNALHFLRPWWFLALLPLPWVLLALARGGSGRTAFSRLADATLLPFLIDRPDARKRLALGLAAVTWALAVVALAGPAWQRVKAPRFVNGAARVVVLSLSSDMLAQDLKPDRMTRAKFAVRDLLDAAGDARSALVAYGGAAFTVAPLTDDKQTILNLLRVLQPDVMPVAGNDAAAGIEQAVALLEQSHVEGGEIVLVTDTADDAAIGAARTASAKGIRVDVLGVGSRAGAPVPQSTGGFVRDGAGLYLARRDDAALRDVAGAGGGRYAVLQFGGGGIASLGAPAAHAGRASAGQRAEVWRDGGVWLLPILLALAALAFRRGWLLVVVLLAAPATMPSARASTWDALWANRDQRALQALRHGDPQTARSLATTPGVRGAADYRAGAYADAARAFAAGRDARSRYNLGNALAKSGKLRKAIAAYDEALKLEPGMADARANRKAVQDWMRRHSRRSGHAQQSGGGRSDERDGNDDGQSRSQTPDRSDAHASSGGRTGSNESAGAQGEQSARGHSGRREPGTPGSDAESRAGASAREDTRQRRQAKEAAKALRRELAAHGRMADRSGKVAGTRPAFALGQDEDKHDGNLDAQQRALLDSVPDDPGALLRRKFLLEWQRRHGSAQDSDQ